MERRDDFEDAHRLQNQVYRVGRVKYKFLGIPKGDDLTLFFFTGKFLFFQMMVVDGEHRTHYSEHQCPADDTATC